jgi:predicted nucleic acid-binding protein
MLLDSNIIIYAALPEHQFLRDLISTHSPSSSWVSYAEVMGFPRLDPNDAQFFNAFFAASRKFDVSGSVVLKATELKRQRRMSLGDSLIAATALIENLTLVTRNTNDFIWITGLQLLNPFAP